jgi:hypothetical protein
VGFNDLFSKRFQKYSNIFQHIPKIFQKYSKNIPKIVLKNLKI